jgi:hypothetical protein
LAVLGDETLGNEVAGVEELASHGVVEFPEAGLHEAILGSESLDVVFQERAVRTEAVLRVPVAASTALNKG